MIPARIDTNDGHYEVHFDATPWFEHATIEEINGLRQIEYGGDYEDDSVVEFVADSDINIEVKAVLEYCNRQDIGFAVYVDEEAAERWVLKKYAEDIRRKVTGED